MRQVHIVAVLLVGIAIATAAPGQLPTSLPACVGDCDRSATVTVDEIVLGVNIALGQRQVGICLAFDRDASESLTVDELVSGVDAALKGCVVEEAEGPRLTTLVLARADDVVVEPADADDLGRPIFIRPFGSGFSLIVEGKPGLDGAAVGHQVFEEAPGIPGLRPDVQVIVSAPLGDGDPIVCDNALDPPGGVPAAEPFSFHEQPAITDVINEMSCRIDSGARTTDRDACTLSSSGEDFGFAFVDASSKVQYCLPIARAWAFPPGDTVIAARLRSVIGNPGEIREIVVRIPETD